MLKAATPVLRATAPETRPPTSNCSRALLERLKDSGGHLPTLESPGHVTALLRRWLAAPQGSVFSA